MSVKENGKLSQMLSSRIKTLAVFTLVLVTIIAGLLYASYRGPLPAPIPKSNIDRQNYILNNDALNKSPVQFPKIIHQMWKDSADTLPGDLKRWSDGCKLVNRDYSVRLYTDADLYKFVEDNYPEYWEFFNSLHGVYMADMARVLIVYHYGGIYMDLDFYCHRPFLSSVYGTFDRRNT